MLQQICKMYVSPPTNNTYALKIAPNKIWLSSEKVGNQENLGKKGTKIGARNTKSN